MAAAHPMTDFFSRHRRNRWNCGRPCAHRHLAPAERIAAIRCWAAPDRRQPLGGPYGGGVRSRRSGKSGCGGSALLGRREKFFDMNAVVSPTRLRRCQPHAPRIIANCVGSIRTRSPPAGEDAVSDVPRIPPESPSTLVRMPLVPECTYLVGGGAMLSMALAFLLPPQLGPGRDTAHRPPIPSPPPSGAARDRSTTDDLKCEEQGRQRLASQGRARTLLPPVPEQLRRNAQRVANRTAVRPAFSNRRSHCCNSANFC